MNLTLYSFITNKKWFF